MHPESCDLAIVGGGINGAGIARDAAGRGLSVVLIERDDLAQHTSSASTKLIHGGLRYLEQFEFSLVRKALAEREVLLSAMPHLAQPLHFVVPHDASRRPAWMIRAGLFLYDHLARRERLPGSRQIDLRRHPAGGPLQLRDPVGFEYADGWVDDARLVIANCLAARERGAHILTRTACISARAEDEHWQLTLQTQDSQTSTLRARAMVNASGPWVADFLRQHSPLTPRHQVRLVRGSHIVVPALFSHPYAYLFQHPDGRVVFAIPYQERFTLVGTTEVAHPDTDTQPAASEAEIDYLLATLAHHFRASPTRSDVIWSYSGIRPLLDDGASSNSRVTRDYLLELKEADGAPMLSVFGGKITTYRVLAEEALAVLSPLLAFSPERWTASEALPGGELPADNLRQYIDNICKLHPQIPVALLTRWAHAYGSRCTLLLKDVTRTADLGEEVLPGLYARELHYLVQHEWAHTAQDILWRRSKLGLHYLADGIHDAEAHLDHYLSQLAGART